MHGWNIVYGLINFAILAVGLYLIGRKIVANAIRAHREKVSGDLEKSAASRENAKKLLDGIEGENAKGESEREEILRQARASVEDIHRAAREQEKKEIDKIALDAHKDLRRLAHHQRILVNQKAAGEITAAAAEQIARPENAAARERMTTQFISRLDERLQITPGDLSAIRSRGSLRLRIGSSEALKEEELSRIRAAVGDESTVIILTSFNWDDIADEARAAGVDTFVSKPLFAGSVMDEFRAAFRRKMASRRPERAQLEGRHVLLAEDVAVNAEIMVMVLGMRGIEAEVAYNGRVAVEKFLDHPEGYFDAILMDMRMPVMDGLEASRAIRASGRADAAEIPIIALTANAFDEDVQRSLQAGLNAHLSKPVEPDALFDTLETLIRD